jgi:ABC-type enterochelin transport system permease subunit
VNIRDDRTIAEQIKSGFRIAAWFLLAMALIGFVLGSTAMLLGKSGYAQHFHRVLGLCGLLGASTAMFVTASRWAKWLVGLLGYLILKTAFVLFLGSLPSGAYINRPQFLESLVVLVLAMVLCVRYVTHAPRPLEGAALVGLVVASSFSVISESSLPGIAGVAGLGLIQIAYRKRHPRTRIT